MDDRVMKLIEEIATIEGEYTHIADTRYAFDELKGRMTDSEWRRQPDDKVVDSSIWIYLTWSAMRDGTADEHNDIVHYVVTPELGDWINKKFFSKQANYKHSKDNVGSLIKYFGKDLKRFSRIKYEEYLTARYQVCTQARMFATAADHLDDLGLQLPEGMTPGRELSDTHFSHLEGRLKWCSWTIAAATCIRLVNGSMPKPGDEIKMPPDDVVAFISRMHADGKCYINIVDGKYTPEHWDRPKDERLEIALAKKVVEKKRTIFISVDNDVSGDTVVSLMKALGLNEKYMAKLFGNSDRTIRRWMNDGVKSDNVVANRILQMLSALQLNNKVEFISQDKEDVG